MRSADRKISNFRIANFELRMGLLELTIFGMREKFAIRDSKFEILLRAYGTN
jgi:hypothetical protein